MEARARERRAPRLEKDRKLGVGKSGEVEGKGEGKRGGEREGALNISVSYFLPMHWLLQFYSPTP